MIIREFADGLHHFPLIAQALADREMFPDRVRTTRFAVSPQQGVLAGFDKNKRDRMLAPQKLEQRRQFFKLNAFAGIH
jgi:hypothetical protein